MLGLGDRGKACDVETTPSEAHAGRLLPDCPVATRLPGLLPFEMSQDQTPLGRPTASRVDEIEGGAGSRLSKQPDDGGARLVGKSLVAYRLGA
jgi:hypothetical protein